MSTINVTNLRGRGGASPNLPDGANVTGVVTATSFVGSGEGLTGVASTDYIITGTAATFNNLVNVNSTLKVTGITTLGNLVVNKSASGAGATVGSYTGVTTYYGDGGSLTGVGETIAPWNYNPDVNDTYTTKDIGIGITFNKKVLGGSGTATLKIVNAGVAGTTVQSWGVSSCTFDVTKFTLGELVTNLTAKQTYQLDIPSGFIVDSTGTEYVGTAWTFATTVQEGKLWAWGENEEGVFGNNVTTDVSSPIQIPGTDWSKIAHGPYSSYTFGATRTDGTLWTWGYNNYGQLGVNDKASRSSPVQVPGTTWALPVNCTGSFACTRTDGTLWTWGDEDSGMLGQNDGTRRSSPTQVPGTTWGITTGKITAGGNFYAAVKTDGTVWTWGNNRAGMLGHNNKTSYSSPKQIPGTSWSVSFSDVQKSAHIRTDGTMWMLGKGHWGSLGMNNTVQYSSPVQLPGTNWAHGAFGDDNGMAVKTDGTLWTWGTNGGGQLGQNSTQPYSSPVQVPGTTWNSDPGSCSMTSNGFFAAKTDGTLWGWGQNATGQLGQNNGTGYSSPIQIASGSGTNFILINAQYAKHAIELS